MHKLLAVVITLSVNFVSINCVCIGNTCCLCTNFSKEMKLMNDKLFPKYYYRFSCASKQCPDTCCKGLDIELDTKSVEVYNNFKGKLKRLVKNNIVCINGKSYIKSKDGQCVFLTDDKLCKLHLVGGESALCYPCQFYPRYTSTYNECICVGLSLSCPIACRLILYCDSESYPFFSIEGSKSIHDMVGVIKDARFSVKKLIHILKNIETREFQAMDLSSARSGTEYVNNELSDIVLYNLCKYFYYRYNDLYDTGWENISFWFAAIASFMISNHIIIDENYIYKIAKDIEHSIKSMHILKNVSFR